MASPSAYCTYSRGIFQTPHLPGFGFINVRWLSPFAKPNSDFLLVWGKKPNSERAKHKGSSQGIKILTLEDGFLRSFGSGAACPPLSMVVDTAGIYYDSTHPSDLESMLIKDGDLSSEFREDVHRAKELISRYGISKYNHLPSLSANELAAERLTRLENGSPVVLVVDQTFGDMSIEYAMARAGTFSQMLDAALDENPDALVVVKTHPETAAGRKGGHFHDIPNDRRILVLREAVQPASLLALVDSVYVVSSTLGFEALMAGKPVHCFGMPWYAGWGATIDRQKCPRRSRTRSVDELFAAAYLRYTRYINPETGGPGTIFDVIRWLVRQRKMAGLDRTPCSMT